jgi:23S rRNA (pseudouridine1915-N3)-methyltransferase
MSGASG